MANQQLVDYIKASLAQNQSQDQIKQNLLQSGWQDGDTAEAFNAVNLNPPVVSEQSKFNISLKSELQGLSRIIRIFGWVAVIAGVLGVVALTTMPASLNINSAVNTAVILSAGILYLVIAEGLSRKKRWSWYLGVVVFIFASIFNIIAGSIINILSGIIALIFLALLLKGKKLFFEQSE